MHDVRRVMVRVTAALAIGAALASRGLPLISAQQTSYDQSLYAGLRWRSVGPFRGGRVDAVSGVPGRPEEFYFGAVNGGVWKTVNAGRTWMPVFDGQPVASIGAIAVAPSRPDTVYVGSGESTLRDSVGYGNGVYKSTDAGKTWTHIGLDDTQHIGKVAVDPKNPDIVFAAAIGHLYAANPDRGVFRSKDGGKTWSKVLYKNDSVGAVEVVIDPTNSQVVYAGLWNTRRPPWYTYQPSNGPGGGLFKSTDGGTTWTQLAGGLPTAGFGHSGLAIAPSNPRRLYAVVDTGKDANGRDTGGFYRSDDAGATWTSLGDTAPGLYGRGWYFEVVAVDPKNPDIVYVPNVAVYRSKDAGKSWVTLRGSPGGDDYHQAWVSPDDPNRMIVASDQGAIITVNATTDNPKDIDWSSWLNQSIAQIYHVSADYRFPYWLTGAQQDSGAVAVRTRGKFGSITMRDWEPIGAGGESGYTAADPLHPGIIFGGTGTRFDLEQNSGTPTTSPRAGADASRTDWTQPLVFSKADPHVMYYADQFLFRTADYAKTWTQISPDLTRPDPGVPASLDEASAADTDRNGKRGVIYTVAPSPLKAALIWIGTDDGVIQVTQDEGKNWQNVTPPALTSWSRVTTVEASHFDANEAYASVDRHQLQDFDPYLYRTRDAGKTWQAIAKGLPAGVYVHVIKEDPGRRGLLFAGTERAIYVSFDDGDSWKSLQLNLPVTSMRDVEIHGDDLIVATHGRGFWLIDDISPLRQLDASVASAEAHLFKPADATNVIQGGDNGTPTQKDEPFEPNPPNGAYIYYFLKTAASGPVTLDIVDESGATIRTFTSAAAAALPPAPLFPPNITSMWRPQPEMFSAAAGLHRWVWDLRPEAGAAGRAGGAGRAGRAGGAGRGGWRGMGGRGRRGGGGGRGRSGSSARWWRLRPRRRARSRAGQLHGEAHRRREDVHAAARGESGPASDEIKLFHTRSS